MCKRVVCFTSSVTLRGLLATFANEWGDLGCKQATLHRAISPLTPPFIYECRFQLGLYTRDIELWYTANRSVFVYRRRPALRTKPLHPCLLLQPGRARDHPHTGAFTCSFLPLRQPHPPAYDSSVPVFQLEAEAVTSTSILIGGTHHDVLQSRSTELESLPASS